jgi:hypothetical protein
MGLFLWGKWPEQEGDYLPASNAVVKNAWICIATPPRACMVCIETTLYHLSSPYCGPVGNDTAQPVEFVPVL